MREIQKYLDEMIKSPEPIFVKRIMGINAIKKEIEKKFSEGKESFDIFARATRVMKAARAIEEVAEKRKDVLYKIELDRIASSNSVTIHVQKFKPILKKKKKVK